MTTPAETSDDHIVTLNEAYEHLDRAIARRTLRHWAATGRLTSFKPGRKYLVRLGDLRALLAASRQPKVAP